MKETECLPNKLKTNQLLIKTESWFFHSNCSNIVSFVKANKYCPEVWFLPLFFFELPGLFLDRLLEDDGNEWEMGDMSQDHLHSEAKCMYVCQDAQRHACPIFILPAIFPQQDKPLEHSDSCQGPNDTHNLFNCPANPTTSTPREDWEDPKLQQNCWDLRQAGTLHTWTTTTKRATTTTTTNGRSSLLQSDVQTHIFFHFWVENRTCVSSTLVEYL